MLRMDIGTLVQGGLVNLRGTNHFATRRMWLSFPAIIFVVASFYINQTLPRESSSGMGAVHQP